MKHKIFKWCHYGFPFPFPKLFFNKKEYYKEVDVKFNWSAIYNIGEKDQMDVNKLFGISYGLHHSNSDRIGWRNMNFDDVAYNKIELVMYSYVDGKRKPARHLCWLNPEEVANIKFKVTYCDDSRVVWVSINDECRYSNILSCKGKLKWLWYTLGLYFGGNHRAPHTITIETN